MAEEKAAKAEDTGGGGAPASASGSQKPMLFIILLIINMLVIGGIGFMVFMDKKKQDQKAGIDEIVQGEKVTQKSEKDSEEFIGKLVPLETFLVNLSGARGRKLVKINMELEVSGDEVQAEIEKLKPKIRDVIIFIVSGKTYAEVADKEGKDQLKGEIEDKVNLFLTKGQIKRVYFTEFIYN